MAAAPCGSACAAAPWGAARHQAVKSSALIRTQQVSPHSVAGKVRGVTLPTSNIYSQNSLLLNLRPCRGSCRQRGSRLIVRAAADYYSVLGVSKEASKTDIRSAYRKIVKSYHPDVNKEPGAEQVIKGELPQLQGKASLCMAYGWCQQIHTILSTKHQFFSPNIWLASRLELKS